MLTVSDSAEVLRNKIKDEEKGTVKTASVKTTSRMHILSKFLPLLFLLATISCDGFLELSGEIYTWEDAPTGFSGEIVLDQPVDKKRRLSPIEAVMTIVLYYNPQKHKDVDKLAWRKIVRCQPDGRFHIGLTCSPGKFQVLLRVTVSNLQPVELVFKHNPGRPQAYQRTVIVYLPPNPESMKH